MTLLQIHLVAACGWLGLIAGETTMELMAKDRPARQFVAKVHRTIDIYFEAPLVTIVLATGTLMLYQLWPNASALLLAKVAIGLLAVIANVFCIHWVLGRARAKDDEEYLEYAQKISFTGYTIPLAIVALAIGLYGV